MTKVGIGSVVGIFMLIGVIASIVTSNYFLIVLLMPPLIAFLVLSVMYKIGLIPKPLKKGQRYCIPSGKDTAELAQIFKRANKYVYAIGGELAHDIWFDKKVVEEIKKAVERGVEIKIACGPRFDVDNFEIAKMANEGKISFFKLKSREGIHHYRINEKYDTLYHSGIDNRKDMVVWFNNDFSGKLFEERFNKTLEEAIKIDKGNFMTLFRAAFLKIDEMGKRSDIVNEDDISIKRLSKYLNE